MNWNNIIDIRRGTYTSDMKIHDPLGNDKGATFSDTEQSWTYLAGHESLHDIYDTINHEAYHVALRREDFTIETEHILIRKLNQVFYGLEYFE